MEIQVKLQARKEDVSGYGTVKVNVVLLQNADGDIDLVIDDEGRVTAISLDKVEFSKALKIISD